MLVYCLGLALSAICTGLTGLCTILAVCIKHVGMLLINTVCFAIIIVFVVLVFASHAFNVPFSLSI